MPGSSEKMTDEERDDYFACLREELGAGPNESLIDAAQRLKRVRNTAYDGALDDALSLFSPTANYRGEVIHERITNIKRGRT